MPDKKSDAHQQDRNRRQRPGRLGNGDHGQNERNHNKQVKHVPVHKINLPRFALAVDRHCYYTEKYKQFTNFAAVAIVVVVAELNLTENQHTALHRSLQTEITHWGTCCYLFGLN